MLRYERIQNCLTQQFSPTWLSVVDESHTHQRPGVETHFKIIVVSVQFDALPLLQRHRLINTCLHEEFQTGLHALSVYVYTPLEWEKRSQDPESPQCQGRA